MGMMYGRLVGLCMWYICISHTMVLQDTSLTRKICLVNCSGIYTHVGQSQESEVTSCVLSTEHLTAVLFDTSDIWIAVSLEASSVPLKA